MASPTSMHRFHIHRSSLIVALALTIATSILVFPRLSTGAGPSNNLADSEGWPRTAIEYEHGWPFVFLTRTALCGQMDEIPLFGVPCLSWYAWYDLRAEDGYQFLALNLLSDLFVMLAIVVGLSAMWEWRRRRRNRPFQFSMFELLLLTTLLAVPLGWFVYQRDEYNREQIHRKVLEEQYEGAFDRYEDLDFTPKWLVRLVGRDLLSPYMYRITKVVYDPEFPDFSISFASSLPDLLALKWLVTLEIDGLPEGESYPFSSIARLSQLRTLELSQVDYEYPLDLAAAKELIQVQQITKLIVTFRDGITHEAWQLIRESMPNCKVVYGNASY